MSAADPGAASLPGLTELLAEADEGLYRAKDEGRDRVGLLVRPDLRAAPPCPRCRWLPASSNAASSSTSGMGSSR